VKRNTTVARVTEAASGLERIIHLEEQLALAPVDSRQRRTLNAAIRIETDAYRKSLDTEQATATHDCTKVNNTQRLMISGGKRSPL
jgi:Tfp pilus assembly protein PilO